MRIRCLSLTQPWATLIAAGAKRIESRSWGTSYRGPLGIHAARGFPRAARARCFEEPFRSALRAGGVGGPDDLPRGAIVAVANLDACWYLASGADAPEDELERAFGDYAPGRYAWHLSDVRRLPEPVPARGRLGLWVCEI